MFEEKAWIVHKFGGTSVADAACFVRVAEIVEARADARQAVVVSACRGVTDALLGVVAAVFLALPLVGLLQRTPWGDLGDLLTEPEATAALRLSLVVAVSATP